MHRITNPIYWPDFVFNLSKNGKDHAHCLKTLHEFTRSVIKKRDAQFDESSLSHHKRVAFLDMLLKAKRDDPTLTYDDIQEEVDTFMFEGHDTTAVAASWACHLIGSHPEVQKKLHEEMDRVYGDSTRHVENDDFKELKYLDCVIKETLRLFPSVPFIGRKLSEDCQVGKF